MPRGVNAIYHFNRGIISRLALARVDTKRAAFSASEMTNWVPRVLGSMMLRPGLQYLGSITSRPKLIPFVFSVDDKAIIEATNLALRFWIGDALLVRSGNTTGLGNGNFDTDLSFWLNHDDVGATSSWATGGYMQLVGDGTNYAVRDQQGVVAAADIGVEHGLRVVIQRGPVTFSVGSSQGADDYVTETSLGTGTHSLAFTPSGDFFVRFKSNLVRLTLVDSCNVEAAGVVSLPAPWGDNDLQRIRWDQSADVIFVACKGIQQQRIERRSVRSWSVVTYQANDGPFRTENVGATTIAPSALNGNVTLTASAPLFRSNQVGGLIQIASVGQRVSASISTATFTNTIRVTGVGESRRFTWAVSGTWSGGVGLQRSVGTVGFWETVDSTTVDVTKTLADGLDNQVVYYRLGFPIAPGSGTAVCTLTYTTGSITGTARITAFTSTTVVSAEVLTDFGGTDASQVWSEGSWSDRRGWPTAVTLYEGRLWWFGKNGIWGSISDAFDSFDPSFIGDAGPINRTVGSGPVDDINWGLPLQRLLLGGGNAELSVRSTTFDEPLSPTNFNIKEASTQGSAPCHAVKFDSRGVYVHRSTNRIYELAFDPSNYDYGSTDLTVMVPEITGSGVVGLAVQRQPDTRFHAIRSDGFVALGVIDRAESVLSWQTVATEGAVLDAVVLPGVEEDSVYYAVQRSLGPTGITSLSITPGTGFSAPPTLTFTDGGGQYAAATVDLKVVSVAVTAAGSAYGIGNILTVVGGTAVVPATVQVTSVDGSGAVLSAVIVAAGDYTAIPSSPASTSGGAGTGCTVTLTWGLGPYSITSSGYGYSSAPTVTVVGTGSGASVVATIASVPKTAVYLEKWAKESECRGGTLNKQADSFVLVNGTDLVGSAPPAPANLTNGVVSSLSVQAGRGYTSVPTLNFSGGGGTGAAATASLAWVPYFNGSVTQFGSGTITGGYSVGDVISLVGGTFTRPAKFKVIATLAGGVFGAWDQYIQLVDGGSYTVLPPSPAPFSGGTGSGSLTYDPINIGLGAATLTAPGTGYTSAPTVSVVGGGGTGGAVSASITLLNLPSAPPAPTTSGLSHLEGNQVIVWGDGKDLSPDDNNGVQKTYTVSNGTINLGTSVSQAIVGLPYTGTWVSAKLVQEAGQSTMLNQRKRLTKLGLILIDTHSKGLSFGSSLNGDPLDPLPLIEEGAEIPYDQIWLGYDADSVEVPGEWSTDSRLWLVAKAPRPCNILGATLAMEEWPDS